MLGRPTAEVRHLADTFARAVAAFVATGGPPTTGDSRTNPATVRHFA
jgi:para-nitrobenzyl esterase